MPIGKCHVDNLKFSSEGQAALEDIRSVISAGKQLSITLSATPFYSIFFSPGVTNKPIEYMINIRKYDWDIFTSAMQGVHKKIRRRVFLIAYEQEIFSVGEERKFWNCIGEATK